MECIVHPSLIPSLIAPLAGAGRGMADQITAGPLPADLPTDPASVTVLLLFLGSLSAVVWFGRDQRPPD